MPSAMPMPSASLPDTFRLIFMPPKLLSLFASAPNAAKWRDGRRSTDMPGQVHSFSFVSAFFTSRSEYRRLRVPRRKRRVVDARGSPLTSPPPFEYHQYRPMPPECHEPSAQHESGTTSQPFSPSRCRVIEDDHGCADDANNIDLQATSLSS